jgi:hypothetical protein
MGLLLLGGCDSGSKRESLTEQLLGPWDLQRLEVGGTDFRNRDVRFTVSEREGPNAFRLVRRRDGADSTVVEGRIEVFSGTSLSMSGPFLDGVILWTFTFDRPDELSSSVQFQFQRATRDETVRDFLSALGVSGTARSIEIDFVRPSS